MLDPGTMSNNRSLLIAALGFGAIALLVWLLQAPESELSRLSEQSFEAHLTPVWPTPSAEASQSSPDTIEDRVVIYVDTSHSMGGFLPLPGAELDPEQVSLRTVAQLVPGHLLSTGFQETRWLTVDETVQPLDASPAFEQSTFVGPTSDGLDSAISGAINAFDVGNARGAVVITDLVATDNAKGAMGLSAPLLSWLRYPDVATGGYQFGILGVRLPYWGVRSSRCSGQKDLGCWYSEHADQYKQLTAVASRPLYLLILGGSDGPVEDEGEHPIDRVGRSLEAALRQLDLTAYWELLTERPGNEAAALACKAHKLEEEDGQYALYRAADGAFECRRSETVRLQCTLEVKSADAGDHRAWNVLSTNSSWPAVAVEAEGNHIDLLIDCEALRRQKPKRDLQLVAEVEAPSALRPSPLASWSTDSDEFEDLLESTLQLDLFLDTVRLEPRFYRLELDEPLLRAGGS